MRSQTGNKKTESYPVVLSDFLDIREEGKKNNTDNKAVKNSKRLLEAKCTLGVVVYRPFLRWYFGSIPCIG